jgi:hypothetical protein
MKIGAARVGDLYLLFHKLPFDFGTDLPLDLGPGVCLDSTPQYLLDKAEPALASYVLPGYNLPSSGLNNCCLRCYSDGAPDLSPADLLFISLLALRLRAPIGISIAGRFKLGPEHDPIGEPTLYQTHSSWQPRQGESYSSNDIIKAAAITRRLIQVSGHGYNRIVTSIVFFSHVTLSNSFQLSYLGLFAGLEALFVPEGKGKGNKLGRRISRFLGKASFPADLGKWIEREYNFGRNKLAHGVHDASLGTVMRTANSDAFGRLHEIARLCILGFISMKDNELSRLSSMTGTSLQAELDKLPSASGPFVEGQQMWLG